MPIKVETVGAVLAALEQRNTAFRKVTAMRTVTGSTTEEAGRVSVTFPGVEFVGKERAIYEGNEYLLLSEESFPGMARMLEEHFTHPDGHVLTLEAEDKSLHIYEVYGVRTHFTSTDTNTGKTKVHRQYLNGVCNAILQVRETLEEISWGSCEPVADFIDGDFGE